MKLLFFRNLHLFRSLHRETGAAMVMVLLSLFLLIAMVALGIDVANLYRAKIRVQRTVDAAAVRGASLLTSETDMTAVADAVEILAKDNLIQSNIFDQQYWDNGQQINVTVDPVLRQVSVTGRAIVPTLLMNVTPWYGTDQNLVQASAIGESANAAISIVLDTTASMNCPAVGDCGRTYFRCADYDEDDNCVRWEEETDSDYCMDHYTEPVCTDRGPTKLDALKTAVKDFVGIFDPSFDQLSITTFSSSATVEKTMGGGFSIASVRSDIDALTAVGGTNIQAGILRGGSELSRASSSLRPALVLFTDGAPNVSLGATCVGSSDDRNHYIRAIEVADSVRSNHGANFFTVGLGTPNGSGVSDAYETISDDSSLKPNLLRRISNASSGKTDPAFDCVEDHETYNNHHAGISNGYYFEAPQATELIALFRAIGQIIQVRLSS